MEPVPDQETKLKIVEYMKGTTKNEDDVIDWFELNLTFPKIEEYDITEIMLEFGLERCPGCGWWVNSFELIDEESEEKLCDSCEPLPNE